jgi:hypothetical protein
VSSQSYEVSLFDLSISGGAATMTLVRIRPMSSAGDLVSFVSRRAEGLPQPGWSSQLPQMRVPKGIQNDSVT